MIFFIFNDPFQFPTKFSGNLFDGFQRGIYRNKIRGRKNEELTEVYVIVLALCRAIGVRFTCYRTGCSRELSLNITICLKYCVMQPALRFQAGGCFFASYGVAAKHINLLQHFVFSFPFELFLLNLKLVGQRT